MRLALLTTVIVVTTACCGGKVYPQPPNTPSLEQVVDRQATARTSARSFRAESEMDYWRGGNRVRGEVYIMGRIGARMRFNALNPTGGNVAADLACDGVEFRYIDFNSDCQITGLVNEEAIAQLLGVRLHPDDFLLLAVGSTPTIRDAEGTTRWDKKRGRLIVELTSTDPNCTQCSQTIALDGRGKVPTWDVVESVVLDARGDIEWRLENKKFRAVKDVNGTEFRVPSRSRFRQPKEKADLIVYWKKRDLNLELEDDKWQLEIPPGLPRCGQQ